MIVSWDEHPLQCDVENDHQVAEGIPPISEIVVES